MSMRDLYGNSTKGRLTLAIAIFVLIFASSTLRAQYEDEREPSRVDIFTGASYFTRQTNSAQGYKYPSMPKGVIGEGAYYFTHGFGLEGSGSWQQENKRDSLYIVQVGPVFRYKAQSNGLAIFGHVLGGMTDMSGPNIIEPGSGGTVYTYYNPATWGQIYSFGMGMDYDTPFFHHRMAIRFAQADYELIHVNYGAVATNGVTSSGGKVDFDGLRLTAGLVWHFGGGPYYTAKQRVVVTPEVAASPTLACSATPTTANAGDIVDVTAMASDFDPRYSIAYTWTTTGGHISGADSTISVDTHGLSAATYTASAHATSGKQIADCSASFTVSSPQPPTISCAASPTTVNPGETVTITAQGLSPSNRPLTYSFKTSGGTASGTGNSATLSTTGLPAGPVTVICDTADDLSRTAETTATFNVNPPPSVMATSTSMPMPPQSAHAEPLCDITFDRDRARPTRVDNEAKACLDSVALSLQRSPDAQIFVVGNAVSSDIGGTTLAAHRAVNTKDYLVTEKGIDTTRIEARTGTTSSRLVQTFLVPAGATFDNDYAGSIPVDPAIQPEVRIPLSSYHYVRRRRVYRTTPPPTPQQ